VNQCLEQPGVVLKGLHLLGHDLTQVHVHHIICAPLQMCTTSYVHHFICAPLHVCTTSRVHHFVCAPLDVYTTSCVHHFMCAPLHVCTTSCVHHFMCAPPHVCTASYVVLGYTGTMLVCWRSTAVPRRAARSSNSKTSSPSLCPCSSRPSSPSIWPSTGACLSTMALASSWPWLLASSLVLSSGAWETKCKLRTHHALCLCLCLCHHCWPWPSHEWLLCFMPSDLATLQSCCSALSAPVKVYCLCLASCSRSRFRLRKTCLV